MMKPGELFEAWSNSFDLGIYRRAFGGMLKLRLAIEAVQIFSEALDQKRDI